jgi:diguanylate cyclase (GGDEF)-like protein
LVLWLAYGLSFTRVHGAIGGQGALHTLLTLFLVGTTAWLWGLWLGPFIGAAAWIGHHAYHAYLIDGVWALPPLLTSDLLFEQVTFVAFGAVFGYLPFLRQQLLAHREVSVQAQYDALTGLLNRTALERQLEGIVANAKESGSTFALLFVDLDRFKFVNDTFGHKVGDELLKEVASILRTSVRENDLVARLGGDEFIVALLGLNNPAVAETIARKLVKTLSTPLEIMGKVVSVSASIGIATYPKDGEDVESLTKNADSAMYQVKEAGKNSFNFSTSEMQMRQSRRLEIEQELRWALEQNQLQLLYQPQIALKTNTLVGFEALLRWHHPEMGQVSPEEFIPIAEDAGLILPIGQWLLREACHQAVSWNRLGLRPVRMAVNVSTLQFQQPDFLNMVGQALKDTGMPPEQLEIEITETVLMKEYDLARLSLKKLARVGINTALDDFGTGYSSLAYLQRLPISTLKIDRSFVSGLALSPSGYVGSTVPIVEAICALAIKLGKTVVAEGVETEAQKTFLTKIGCAHAQGYLFSKPVQPYEAEQMLASIKPPTLTADPESERLLMRD